MMRFFRVLVALALLACGKKTAAPDAAPAPTLNVPAVAKLPPVVFDGPMVSDQTLPEGRFKKVFGLHIHGCALDVEGKIHC